MDNNTFEGHVPPPPQTATESDSVFAEVKVRTMASDLNSIKENGGIVKPESVPIKIDGPKKSFHIPSGLIWTVIGIIGILALFFVGFFVLPNLK